MKHFANFAPSYNNIGLGIGAAVGLARGSGLIGESQEERDSTTGLGRLGKLAGYTGGGGALGAGTGMAVGAGTKYLRGRKGTVPEPRPQDRTTAAEPWDDDWTTSNPLPSPSSKPKGYSGLKGEDRADKLERRREAWYDLQYRNHPKTWYDKDTNKLPDTSLAAQQEVSRDNLVKLQNDIKQGYYSKATANTINF